MLKVKIQKIGQKHYLSLWEQENQRVQTGELISTRQYMSEREGPNRRAKINKTIYV